MSTHRRETTVKTGSVTFIEDRTEVTRRGPCVYVTVRDTSNARREFERFCQFNGCVRELSCKGETITVERERVTRNKRGDIVRREMITEERRGNDLWKVVGPEEALAKLADTNHTTRLWWVVDCEYGMNGYVLPANGGGK